MYIDPMTNQYCKLKPRSLSDKLKIKLAIGTTHNAWWPRAEPVTIIGYEWCHTSDGGRAEEFVKVQYTNGDVDSLGPHHLT